MSSFLSSSLSQQNFELSQNFVVKNPSSSIFLYLDKQAERPSSKVGISLQIFPWEAMTQIIDQIILSHDLFSKKVSQYVNL